MAKPVNDIFDKFFTNSIDLLCISDEKGQFMRLNPEWKNILGYDISEMEGKPYLDFVHPDDKEKTTRVTNDIKRNSEVINFTNRYRHKNGTYRTIEWRTFSEEDKIYSSARDITELKKSQKLLNVSQRISKAGSWEYNLEDQSFFWSDSAYNLYGLSKDIVKKPDINIFLEVVYPEDREKVRSQLKKVLEKGELDNEKYRIIRPNGEIRTIVTSAEVLKNKNGQVFKVIGVIHDLTESIEVKEELEESEKKARLFVENTPLPIAMFDTNMCYMTASKRWLTDYKLGDQNIIGRSHYDVFPEIPDRWKDDHQRVLKGEIYRNEADKFIRQDGSTQWLRYELHPWYKNNGNIGGVVMFTEDITKKREAEEALRISQQKLESLFRVVPAGIGIIVERIVIDVNPQICKISGYSDEDIIGKSARILYSDEKEFIRVGEISNEQIKKKGTSEVETIWKRKDGELINIHLGLTPIDPENHSKGITFTALDITSLKNAEKQILQEKLRAEESEYRLKTLHDASLGGIAIHNNGIILDCNQGLSEITLYSNDELMGMNGLLLIAEKWRDHVLDKIQTKYEKPYEVYGVRKNGEEFPLRIEARNIPYKGSNVRSVEFRDITREKQTEFELIKAKEKAEESDNLKTAFLANLSHEIRTPMNGILGFADLLKMEDLTDETKNMYISVIEQSGQRMLSLIADLVDISKIEANQVEIKAEETNLNSLMDKIYDFFKLQAETKQLALSHNNGLSGSESNVMIDHLKLEQALTNLINNALKFTDTGNVYFEYTINNNKIYFTVKDTGVGIPKGMETVIFERFRQAENTHLKETEGSGLGLSISKAFIELMGGEIHVNSTPGIGSEFIFHLPYIPVNTVINKTSKPVDHIFESGITILIAEDDETCFLYLKQILKPKNFKVIHAQNGNEAIELFNKYPEISIILMDLKMPLKNGIDATFEIRRQNPDIPIIAQTAYSSERDKTKALSAGCNDLITKPVKKEVLLEKLEVMLKRSGNKI